MSDGSAAAVIMLHTAAAHALNQQEETAQEPCSSFERAGDNELTLSPEERDMFETCAQRVHFQSPVYIANCHLFKGDQAKDDCQQVAKKKQATEKSLGALLLGSLSLSADISLGKIFAARAAALQTSCAGPAAIFAVVAFGAGYAIGYGVDMAILKDYGISLHEYLANGLYNLVGDKLLIE